MSEIARIAWLAAEAGAAIRPDDLVAWAEDAWILYQSERLKAEADAAKPRKGR